MNYQEEEERREERDQNDFNSPELFLALLALISSQPLAMEIYLTKGNSKQCLNALRNKTYSTTTNAAQK